MIDAPRPPPEIDESPLPCPECGKTPSLVTGLTGAGIHCTARYECRRWFGLRVCRRGRTAIELTGSECWARRAAAVKWNQDVQRHAARWLLGTFADAPRIR